MRPILTIAAILALTACSRGDEEPAAPEAYFETARAVTQGALVGYRAESGADVWKGIPFAAPPTGDLRWRAPRPAAGWSGERQALASAERCPQVTNGLNRTEGLDPGLLIGTEDCLYLDIYAPGGLEPGADETPVMVWIHGGGNVWGRASSYDGSVLAAEQDVIVVAIQYRLGPLGWFAHPALRESAESEADRAASFALLDMIAALEWVEAEIGAFGGDADNVTIFGESAGGHNVAGLLASPRAAGLFDRAIIQSGSLESVPLAEAESESGDYPNPSGKTAPAMAADTSARALRAASVEDVFAPYRGGDGLLGDMPAMIADGVALPEEGIRSALGREGGFNAVPVISGANKDEMKLFNLLDDRYTRRWFGLIYRLRDPGFYHAVSAYQSRMWKILAVDEAMALMRAAGHDDVYGYRFDWDEGGSALTMDFSELLGAPHAMEIPFVFNRFQLFGDLDRVIFNDDNAEGRAALAAAMGGYWAEFARAGAPRDGGGDFPFWNRWGADAMMMRFDSPAGGGPELIANGDSMEALFEDLKSDPALSAGQKCAIAEALQAVYGASAADFLPLESLNCSQ
ncbi:MAG: carboxylesterase family protein [Euryhalocaulis sp.]|uniref:carboxylesterase/lipase family protein n=1 Tax=Euryhalocaulis sp. TaxID=2744307 RepID=UPI0017C0DCEB|nr:carboxylesterase family protein [Euryhalocaulis sp.]MBA4802497.1 carboxylesterase family protein [Euryhalocaulis sp.]